MFLVDMTFTNMNKITPELTQQHKLYLEQEYKSNKLMFGGRKVPRTGSIVITTCYRASAHRDVRGRSFREKWCS